MWGCDSGCDSGCGDIGVLGVEVYGVGYGIFHKIIYLSKFLQKMLMSVAGCWGVAYKVWVQNIL